MSPENYNNLINAEKLSVAQKVGLLVEDIKRGLFTDVEVFAKPGRCGEKFEYVHFAVMPLADFIWCDSEVRNAGWFSLGTATRGAPRRNKLRLSLSENPGWDQRYRWRNASQTGFPRGGERIEYMDQAPEELWAMADQCCDEIAEALASDRAPFVNQNDDWTGDTYVQLIPLKRQSAVAA